MHTPFRLLITLVAAALLLALSACVDLAMEACGKSPNPIGNNEPGTARVRTSHHRAVLADRSAVAGRVLPYALMSAYAYRLGPGCADPGNAQKLDEAAQRGFEARIAATAGGAGAWTRVPALGIRDEAGHLECEDDEGLAYHVWERTLDGRKLVVVAFRGTSGKGDWKYGNLWWFGRFVFHDNQYTRARTHAAAIIRQYDEEAARENLKPPRFVATGHSLGGGLAQQVLYAFPDRVEQAIVFDPSSVTGYVDVDHEHHVMACGCEIPALRAEGIVIEPEPRILRVYQTYEILSDLRIFHKIFFEPERHVMEVRIPFEAPVEQVKRHSMKDLADNLFAAAGSSVAYSGGAGWLVARGDNACTAALREGQKTSCAIDNRALGARACPS
jgi:pimeloyl-ACP methyl ester carboxylesterase